jgi:DNA-binding transcriptional LysR family regulator
MAMAGASTDLRNLDLNLLKVFLAVYEHRRTTLAAEGLDLTQPAVSQALGRLRSALGDPLFVRSRDRMEPTPLARDLIGPVRDALGTIGAAVSRERSFSAPQARRHFRLGMLDYGVVALAPGIAATLSRDAPEVTVELRHMPLDTALDALSADQVDLATGPFGDLPHYFEAVPLFEDDLVVIARRGHPDLRNGLTVEALRSLPHLDISYVAGDRQFASNRWGKLGIGLRRVMSIPHFAAAPWVVGASDLLAITARRPARAFAESCDIEIFDLPVPVEPLRIQVVMHRRNAEDPGLRWLLETVKTSIAESSFGAGDRAAARRERRR